MKFTKRPAISIIALLLMILANGCASTFVTQSPAGTTTTIVLTRHGDRNPDESELNDKGRARAVALVTALDGMDITAIYSPDKKRNLDTARPLADKLGIKIDVVASKMKRVLTTILTEHAGETVLWVGNVINLEELYALLQGDGAAPISYGDLFIVTVKERGKPVVIKKRYGPK